MPCAAVRKRGGLGEVNLTGMKATMAAEFKRVAVQNQMIFAGLKIHGIVGKRLMGMKAEKKDQFSTLEAKKKVGLIFQNQMRSGSIEQMIFCCEMHHGLVEFSQEPVSQVGVIPKVPLAACIFV